MIFFYIHSVTSLEVIEGILLKNDSDKKCLLFIREIICNDDAKKNLEEAGFYNKNEIDNIELENLKINAKQKLSPKNVTILKVIKIRIFTYKTV